MNSEGYSELRWPIKTTKNILLLFTDLVNTKYIYFLRGEIKILTMRARKKINLAKFFL